MKIASVVHYFYPHMGGTERVCYEIARRLVDFGHEVKVITSYDKNRVGKIIDGIKIVECKPILTIFKCPIMPGIISAMIKEDFDIIHINATVPFVSDISLFIAKMKGKKIIYHIHFDGNAEGRLGKILSSIYNKTVARLCCLLADKIVVATKSYAQTSYILHGISKLVDHKIEVIPYGVDADVFRPNMNADIVRKRHGIKDKEPVILFVGRLVPYKSIDLLIRALKNINAKLIIVGNGELKDELKELSANLGVQNKIIFAGYVSDAELPLYYNAADIFVLPSQKRGEAFGVVSLEAMSCGMPVITSNIPGVKDVVPKNCGLKFKDQKDLENKINLLLKNKKLRKQLGRNSRQFILKERTWQKVAKRFERIFKDI